MKRTHTTRWIIAVAAVLVLVLGATVVLAQTPDASDSGTLAAHGGFGGRGHGPDGAGRAAGATYLADALGITVEELQAAVENAQLAALEQAVELGLITPEQAEALIASGHIGHFGFHRGPGAAESGIDVEALLAAELGISVDELAAARETAHQAHLDQALADGLITQEQYDLMQARHALKDAIDREALTAAALDLTVEELAAARAAGTPLYELIADAGLTMPEFMTAMQDAFTAAVNEAVVANIITQDQADLILSTTGGMGGFGGQHGHGGHRGHGGRGFDGAAPNMMAPTAPLNTGSSA